jgi:hypothetical protein
MREERNFAGRNSLPLKSLDGMKKGSDFKKQDLQPKGF